MPQQLHSMVQRMMDAGVPKEQIGAAIQHYQETNPPLQEVSQDEPDTFWGGFGKALTDGTALNAGLKGAKGFFQGAVADLPSSITGAIGSIGHAIAHPVETVENLPSNISDAASNMWDTTTHAGGNPEAFGRMMGQLTGQPLVTAGLAKGAPGMIRASGVPVEAAGSIMKKYQPVSGMLPRLAEGRTLRTLEKAAGGKLEDIGRRMQIPTKMGEIVPDTSTGVAEGEIIPDRGPSRLNPSETTQYGDESFPSVDSRQNIQPRPEVAEDFMNSVLSEMNGRPPAMQIPNQMRELPSNRMPMKELPPSDVTQHMSGIEPDISMDTQSPTAGSHMNSPATKLEIPDEVPGKSEVHQFAKKGMTKARMGELTERGYKFTGLSDKGDFLFTK